MLKVVRRRQARVDFSVAVVVVDSLFDSIISHERYSMRTMAEYTYLED